jgi:hypothetical protein
VNMMASADADVIEFDIMEHLTEELTYVSRFI